MTSNILLPFMATIGACLRLCALLRSESQQKRNQAVPKKELFLQEIGFTDMDPCNIHIHIYIYPHIICCVIFPMCFPALVAFPQAFGHVSAEVPQGQRPGDPGRCAPQRDAGAAEE